MAVLAPGVLIPRARGGGARPWWPAGATLWLDFTGRRPSSIPLSDITVSRASGGTALDMAGNVVSFAANQLRRTDRGVLIEAAATNLCLQSGSLNSPWDFANRLSTTEIAPDGTTTASRIHSIAGTDTAGGAQYVGVVSAATHTYSVFVKQGTAPTFSLGLSQNDPGFTWRGLVRGTWTAGVPVLTIQAGTPTLNSPVALGNGWFRVSFSATLTAVATSVFLYPETTQNHLATGAGTLFWGVQLETGSVATSYIATTSSTATRAFDNVFIAGIDTAAWFSASRTVGGVFVATYRDYVSGIGTLAATNNAGVGSVGPVFRFRPITLSIAQAGGTIGLAQTGTMPARSRRRLAGGFRVSDTRQSISADGNVFVSNTSIDYTGVGANRLQIGAHEASGLIDPLNAYLEDWAFIPSTAIDVADAAAMNALTVLP